MCALHINIFHHNEDLPGEAHPGMQHFILAAPVSGPCDAIVHNGGQPPPRRHVAHCFQSSHSLRKRNIVLISTPCAYTTPHERTTLHRREGCRAGYCKKTSLESMQDTKKRLLEGLHNTKQQTLQRQQRRAVTHKRREKKSIVSTLHYSFPPFGHDRPINQST